jgi:sugar (pentulose or hexulose) kinase
VHTRAHVYRAILEGLAYALREGKERTEKRSGVPITKLRVVGGGSQSNAALQLTADVFGMTAERPLLYEASGLGAAMSAAVGVKIHPDFRTAAVEMTHMGERFEPDPKTCQVYDELYHQVYLKMYGRLRPLYRSLHCISMWQ